MKKGIVTAIFLIFLPLYFVAQVSLHDSITYTFNIKTNPFAMLQGPIMYTSEYRLGFEKPVSLTSAIQVSASWLGKAFYENFIEAAADVNDILLINGYRFQAEYKYYLKSIRHRWMPFNGLYMAINGSYSQAKITTSDYKIHDEYISAIYEYIALKNGYQYCYGRYTFDFFYGLGIRDIIWKSNLSQQNQTLDKKNFVPFNSSLKILLGINIGIRL